MCDYSKLKILYVEDEKSIVAFVKILFKKNNISNVVYAYDGAEALEYYKKENFDIVMTDIMMPKMDGYELITNIRKINSKQIFTIITGQEKTEDLIKAIKTRANFFIQKPILPKEFQDVLKDSIDLACQKNSLDYSNMVLSQYKDAMDSTTILSKTDKEGFITYVNDKFIEISGFGEDELIGQNHNIVRDQDLPKEIFEDLWKTIKINKNGMV
ncbi:MAG: response regulator [Campylobacterota bacterium]|nr:response regulator [Campylobacterota bacterium]